MLNKKGMTKDMGVEWRAFMPRKSQEMEDFALKTQNKVMNHQVKF